MRAWLFLASLLFTISCSRGDKPFLHEPKASESEQTVDAGDTTTEGSTLSPSEPDAGSGEPSRGAAGQAGSAPVAEPPAGGAGGATAAVSGSGGMAGGAGEPAAGSGGAAGATQAPAPKASDEVFRDDLLRTYELAISDEDWEHLQETALEELYVPAVLTVEGQQLGTIGVRYKGNFGTLQECFRDGMKVCRKLSFKLKFDEYDPALRYRGLKKLNFHSSLRDHSHLHERVAYKLFREFGVLAPRSVHARLMINGEYRGLYNLTEEVDGRFTDHRFSGADGQGTLYKEAWPARSQDPGYYTNAQQTNEGSPVTKVVRFAQEIADAPSDQLGEVVSRWMDPDKTLRYLAVHTATNHWDGPLTFYCSEDYGCNNHNYLIYESATRDHFELVAWDTDNTFYEDVLTEEAEVPAWWEQVSSCDHDASDGFLPPSCDPLVRGFAQLGLDRFRDVLDELLKGPYDVDALQSDVDRWAEQIDEAVKSDPVGSGYEDWRGNVNYLKSMIAQRYDETAAIRDSL
jgi:spore coat protein H